MNAHRETMKSSAVAADSSAVAADKVRFGWSYWAALLLVATVIVVPLWMVDYPGMVDYPNHLTRCFVLAHYHSDPIWVTRYRIDHTPLPNLAIDLIVTPLNKFFPLFISGKIFLTFAALLYVGGCAWLGSVIIGAKNWIALVLSFTFYNSTLLYGFVNYVFGVAVFLCAFAFWIQSKDRMSPLRFFICCLFSLATFLCHLSAIMFLGVACSSVAIIEGWRHRKILLLIRQLAWLACPLVLMAGFLHGSGKVGGVEWGTLTGKVVHLFTPIRAYNLRFDVVVIAVTLAAIIVIAKGSQIYSPMAAGGILFALFVTSPEGLFQSSAVDQRYVLPAYLLVLLSIKPSWNRTRTIALTAAAFAMVARTADIATNWRTIDRRERQVLKMGDALPENSRVYVIRPTTMGDVDKLDRGFFQVSNLWVVSKHASISALFAGPGMQPLVARQSVCNILDTPSCAEDYDFIWSDQPTPSIEQYLRSVADPAATWESVTLWKIRR